MRRAGNQHCDNGLHLYGVQHRQQCGQLDATTINPAVLPDLTIAKTHSGNFAQNQNGAAYALTVTNGGTAATSGTVTVTDTLPAGLTFASGSGGGFTCSALAQVVTCTSTTAIAVAAMPSLC